MILQLTKTAERITKGMTVESIPSDTDHTALGRIHHLISKLNENEEKRGHGYDYIIFDMSPAASIFNLLILRRYSRLIYYGVLNFACLNRISKRTSSLYFAAPT